MTTKLILLLLSFSLTSAALAEKESRIHSENGINDAHDESVKTPKNDDGKQEEQARPVSDPTDFAIGPYDRNGNFNYRTKKEETEPGT